MNDRSFDQLLDAWMDLGPASAPTRVADAVRLEVRATRQTAGLVGWPPRRFPVMNTTAKIVVGAAAVIVAALLGYGAFVAPNVGGPSVLPSQPTSTPTPTQEPPPAAVDFTAVERGGTELQPGRYRIEYAAPVEVIITIPDEPFGANPSAWYKGRYDWGPWHQSNRATLGVMDVDVLSTDPCASGVTPSEDVGPTVADLADALERVEGLVAVRSEASLDGYAGVLVEITGTERPADCVSEPMLWLTNHDDLILLPDTGESHRIWILDVEGQRLVVVAAGAEAVADQLQELVDSIDIVAP